MDNSWNRKWIKKISKNVTFIYKAIIQYLFQKNQSSSRRIRRGITLTNNPWGSEINNDQNRTSILELVGQPVKKIIKMCFGWKRFNISLYLKSYQELIPTSRIKQDIYHFQSYEQITQGHLYVKQKEEEIIKFNYCSLPVASWEQYWNIREILTNKAASKI